MDSILGCYSRIIKHCSTLDEFDYLFSIAVSKLNYSDRYCFFHYCTFYFASTYLKS